jgi:hypothetical protein
MATETTAQDSVAQSPAPAKTSAKKAKSKRRTSKKTAPKKAVAKKRTTKKSAAKKPVAAKKSVAKKPAAKKSASKRRKPKKHTPSHGTINKAQAIRDVAKELGKKARPKDIIAALAAKGITVSPQQVSTTLKAAGLRRGRRRRKGLATVAAKKNSGNGQGLNINELLQVKKLAEQLGGAARLKELAAALERLS